MNNLSKRVDWLERKLLGGMMLENSTIGAVQTLLRGGDMESPAHALICQAIQALHFAGDRVDIVAVTNHLRGLGVLEKVGGAAYVAGIVDAGMGLSPIDIAVIATHLKLIQRAADGDLLRVDTGAKL